MDISSLIKDYQTGGKFGNRPVQPSDRKNSYQNEKGEMVNNVPGSDNWYYQQAMCLWWQYSNNYTDLNWQTRQEMIMNRLYAEGRQPAEKYMGLWQRWNKKANRMETWANISFDIYAVIPKMVAYVKGTLSKVDFSVQCSCVDESAGTEREEMIWKQVVQKNNEFYKQANQMLGRQEEPPQQELPFIPTSKEQAQMLVDMGFVKLTSEADLEELMHQSAQDGRWKEVIKPKLEVDGFGNAILATKVYVDRVSQRILPRYVDPVNLIARWRQTDNYYQTLTHVGEIVPYTIGDLRAVGFKDRELEQIAQYYGNRFGNPAYAPAGAYFNPQWNDFLVWVLDFEFESVDFQNHKWVEFDQETGEYIPTDEDTPISVDSKDRVVETAYPKWHRAKWVIGSNAVFDTGFQFDCPYTQNKRPESNYSVVRISDRSSVSLIIADADDLQNMVLKRRAAVAKLRPPGIIVDKNAFQEVEAGGQKFLWTDNVRMFNQTGDAVIQNPVTPTGQAIPGVPPPFYENKGTIGVIQDYDASIINIVNNMASKAGISSPVEGSAPNPNMPVTTTQIALEGTNNILRPILLAYQSIKKQTFSKIAYHYEIRSKAHLLKSYEGIIGAENIDLMSFINLFHHGINVDAIIDDDSYREIIESAKLSLQAAKTGGVGITDGDFMAVRRLAKQGLYLSAELMLNWRNDVRKKEAQDLQAQNMKLNGDNMKMQEQLKMQAMQMKMQLDGQNKLNIENADTQKQMLLLMQEFKNQMILNQQQYASDKEDLVIGGHVDESLIASQGQVDEHLAEVQGGIDLKLEKAKPKPKPASKSK